MTTRWSLVLAAGSAQSKEARGALETLCQAYWFPLYAYARRKGNAPELATDLVQSFFLHLLERSTLDRADQTRGRFRSFLLKGFQNFVRNEHARAEAEKRGGGKRLLSLDVDPEEAYRAELSHDETPERCFEREWALSLLERALGAVREDYASRKQSAVFQGLKSYLVAQEPRSYADVASELDMSEGAARVAVHRLRERYGRALRRELRDTLGEEVSVEDELDHLFAALAK